MIFSGRKLRLTARALKFQTVAPIILVSKASIGTWGEAERVFNAGRCDLVAARLTSVDKKVLRKHRMLPLRVEDGCLVVAMRDPTNLYALEDLRMLSGYPVSPVVVAEGDLRRAFGALFGAGDEVAELLEEAAAESPARAREEVELGEDRGPTGAPTVRLVGSILRCDPDVVMIGEIRDRETDKTSVEAALTGHLVLTTFRIY